MNLSIKEIEKEIIEEFELFDNWVDKYEYLIDLGKSLPKIEEHEKTNENISFESGTTPLSKIAKKIDSGEYEIAFILKPISISALKEVADNNRFMPPKSTYIEPKLRSGLTIYSLE